MVCPGWNWRAVAIAHAIAGWTVSGSMVLAESASAPISAPSEADVEAARRQLRTSFHKQYREAQSLLDRDELAWFLINSAGQSTATPEQQFAALDEAATIAAQAGSAATALTAVDRLLRRFSLDPWQQRIRVVRNIRDGLSLVEQRYEYINRVEPIVRQSASAGHYAVALELAALLVAGARGTGDNQLMRRLGMLQTGIKAIEKAAVIAEPHEARLAEFPKDAEASLQVGRFLCLYRADWETGLPLLAQGSDDALQTLASRSVSVSATAKEWAEVGNGWWDLSRKESGIARTNLAQQAIVTYQRALEAGLDGAARTRIEKRVKAATRRQPRTVREKAAIVPAQMLPVFGMDPLRWSVTGDELHGRAAAMGDELERYVSAQPVTANKFRFGYRIKARQYHAISVLRGDEVYEYSRGHWANGASLFRTPQQGVVRHDGRELVRNGDDWHSLGVEFSRGELVFYYDGLPVARTPLKTGRQPGPLRVGFGSYMTKVQIKDMFLSTGR